jgi:hypothetical protein
MASRQRSCRARRVIFLNAAAWLVPALLWAQERPAALHGVNAVTVGVSIDAPDGVVPVGLTEARLRTIAELKLRSWTLTVVPPADAEKNPGARPRVDLDVIMLETRSIQKLEGYAFHTRLAVIEPGISIRNGAPVNSELWSQSFLNVSTTKSITADVERAATELLDEFINEWLRARR